MDSLSEDQVVCLLRSAFYRDNVDKLVVFHEYWDADFFKEPIHYQFYLQTKIYVHLKKGNHEKVIFLIKNHHFDKRFHEYLQFERAKQHKISAVDRFRIRKKNPFPPSIWNGERIFYSFSEKCVSMLNEYYARNKYPCCQVKEEIAQKADLTLTRVTNWFKNRRQRDRLRQMKTEPRSQSIKYA